MKIKEYKADGKVYEISIFINESGKYQYVNLTKEKICPCEFNSYEEAFADLLKYIKQGKIKMLSFEKKVGGGLNADISVEKRMV